MDTLLLLSRLLLALVFGLAGASKLGDSEGSRKALRGFGVSESLAAPLVWLLPVAELLTAFALLPKATAWLGGLAALGLLLAFLAGIAINLAKGNAPDCHCFGQLHSEPVSWTVFARNLALAGVAAFIVAQGRENPGASAFTWLSEMRPIEAISFFISLIAVGLLVVTLRMMRGLSAEVTAMKKLVEEDYAAPEPVERKDAAPPAEGLPIGAPAPSFTLPTLAGDQVSLHDLLAHGKAVMLLFVSPNCSPCKTLLPFVRSWQRDYAEQLTIAVISRGSETEVAAKLRKYDIQHLLLQGDRTLNEEYQALWTPTAVLINAQGRIANAVATGEEAIRALVSYAVATSETATPIKLGNSLFKVGEKAPRFALPNLQGEEIAFDSVLTKPTLLLFWNPGCGFCKAMAEELKRWEAKPTSEAQLLFVSTGERDEITAGSAGFRSQFLHDKENDIAPLFGANGTPSGLMLDAEGRIASSLAVGERNLLALLGVRKIELPLAKGA